MDRPGDNRTEQQKYQRLLEVVNSALDGRLMDKALKELDPFIWARPCWQRGPYEP